MFPQRERLHRRVTWFSDAFEVIREGTCYGHFVSLFVNRILITYVIMQVFDGICHCFCCSFFSYIVFLVILSVSFFSVLKKLYFVLQLMVQSSFMYQVLIYLFHLMLMSFKISLFLDNGIPVIGTKCFTCDVRLQVWTTSVVLLNNLLHIDWLFVKINLLILPISYLLGCLSKLTIFRLSWNAYFATFGESHLQL